MGMELILPGRAGVKLFKGPPNTPMLAILINYDPDTMKILLRYDEVSLAYKGLGSCHFRVVKYV